MFKSILVPTDGSALSDKAIEAAVAFAKINGSSMVGLSVSEPYPISPLDDGAMAEAQMFEEQMWVAAQRAADKVAAAAKLAGVPCVVHVARSTSPFEEIIRVANECGCDIIFMSSHGRKGLGRLLIGSETQKVLTHSTIPVLVFR